MDGAFPLEDLIRLPDFHNPVASPDGDTVAFYYDETGRVELYVQDLDSGDRTRISDGNVPRNAIYPLGWRPDGDAVVFHEDEAGDEQNDIHEMTLDGERTPLVEHEGQCLLQDISPNGDLLFTSTAGDQMNCYRYDREVDAIDRLTAYDEPVRTAVFAPDGDRFCYVTNETDETENRDVYVADIADCIETTAPAVEGADAPGNDQPARKLDIGAVGSQTSVADWAGDRLLIEDDTTGFSRGGIYHRKNDTVTWYGPGGVEESARRFAPDGGVITLRRRECGMVPVHYTDPDDGSEFDLQEGVVHTTGGGLDGASTSNGRILTTAQTADGRERLLAYDHSTGDGDTVIGADYADFDPETFIDADYVTYESHDGLEIDGLLYDSGRRPSPALVMVHGGPHAQSTRRFNPFVQYLVASGYTVFAPNYRGSIGRGREFTDAIHEDWGGDEQGDIREAGRWLGARNWVDEDRVAVFGGSYGGYSTYCQLTMHPEEWATGIAIVGMTDLELLYEESMPHFKSALEEQLGGTPEDRPERYTERSPVEHAGEMNRPICIVHGVNDPRCPVSQARIFRDALRDRGWTEGRGGEFEYYELGEEGHGSTDTEQRIRQYRILVDYIDRRL